ncbi:hypothetical protein ACB094_04G048700 [Castanea mollissima]
MALKKLPTHLTIFSKTLPRGGGKLANELLLISLRCSFTAPWFSPPFAPSFPSSFISLSLLHTVFFFWAKLKAGNKATNRNIDWPQPLPTQGGQFLYSLRDSLKPFLIDG